MARFMLLIYGDSTRWDDTPQADVDAMMGKYFAVTQEMVDAGVLRGGDPLHPVDTAVTVGAAGTTDGPFAETAEVLGGYYIVEVADRDAAAAWAAKLPGVAMGLDRIEVREILELPDGA
jgi:hypothetical protein